MSIPTIALASDVVICTGMSLCTLSVALAGSLFTAALAIAVGMDIVHGKRRGSTALIRHDATTRPNTV